MQTYLDKQILKIRVPNLIALDLSQKTVKYCMYNKSLIKIYLMRSILKIYFMPLKYGLIFNKM